LLLVCCFALIGAGVISCPKPVYKAGFSHRLQDPPPRILVTAGLPYYRVNQWVEFAAVPQQPKLGGWMGYAWRATGPAANMEWRHYQDPDSAADLADKVWGRFHTPGKWKIELAVKEQHVLRCRNPKCWKPFPKLPYRAATTLMCPSCKSQTTVPDVPFSSFGGKVAVTRPEEIVIIDIGPRRFIDGEPGKGIDYNTPLITIFPEGGWVFVGERFSLSLFGVQMWTDAGKGLAWPKDRVIKKVEIDFGDGTKIEEYANSSKADEIQHQLIDHIYYENGYYEIKVKITDNTGEEFHRSRILLAVDEPTSGYDKLVGSIVEKLMNAEIGGQMGGKNIIIYNLENLTTYSDHDRLHPIEDQMIQQFHKRNVHVLERDEDVLRRWAPEVFGVLPNSFSKDLQMFTPEEWSNFGSKLQVETARPDFLVEYRIVEENERLDPVGKFNPKKNTWEPVIAEGAGTVRSAKFRKRILKMYFRIVDGKSGPDSTRVLFTDIMTGAAEDFVVTGTFTSGVAAGGGSVAGSQPGRRFRCPQCGSINVVEGAQAGYKVECHSCKHQFPVH
jgi:hypothetical protein